MRLPYRPPFAWDVLLGFFARRAIDGVESCDGGIYRRGPVRVAHEEGALVTNQQAQRVRRLFDLDADPAPIAERLRRDRALASRLARVPGVRVPGMWDPFELAVRAIVGQQISVAGARTILSRIAARYGDGTSFPNAERLADAAIDGMPRRRAASINALAKAVANGEVTLERGATLDDTVARLRVLPGIGNWTAHYIAMRLGEPDAFPAGDLALRRALDDISERELERRAERWRPWRAYAAVLLWTAG